MIAVNKKALYRELTDYVMIGIGMAFYSLGWVAFYLPNHITTGGVAGLSSIIFWGTHTPVQITYFSLNLILLAIALKVLGFKFCLKTIYGVLMMTMCVSLFRQLFPNPTILRDEPFMACIIGSVELVWSLDSLIMVVREALISWLPSSISIVTSL